MVVENRNCERWIECFPWQKKFKSFSKENVAGLEATNPTKLVGFVA